MLPYRQMLESYDSLWQKAEHLIEAYLRECLPPGPPMDANSPQEEKTPDLKEISAIVITLKRIQDARRAIQLDAIKLEANCPDGDKAEDIDHEGIARILDLLRQPENTEGDDEEML